MSADSPAPPPTAPAPPSPAAVVRILHVDDDEANRYAVSRTLRHAGYQVEEAVTGEEALVSAERGPFDLILLDVQLPGMDGFEVARRLRAAPATRHTPVVHLSAHATTPSDRATGLEGGAAAYLTRPIESRELLATIAAMVGVHRAEQHARRSAREWQATFDAIPDAIYLLDTRNRVVRTNAAMRRACGSFGRALVGSEHHVALRALLGTDPPATTNPLEARCEVDVSANGRAYRWTLDPVRDESGATTGAVGIVSDVTERRDLAAAVAKRNDELQLADKRKDEFLAMLAHEIRNPLGAIAAASALLDTANNAGNAPGATPDVVRGTIRRQLRHLTRLVDDLLDVSRITRGKIELRRSRFDLVAVAAQAATAARPAMEAGGHELTFERPVDGERLEIEGDAVRLEQVISNLLDNAAKYTDRGGHVSLSVSANRDEALIRVRDDGIGIAPDRIGHVFELFVQVDPTIDRARGGLGIGLTLVRQIVAMHGGTVTASSEGVGKGSQFEVRLPRSASLEVRESAPADKTPAQGLPAESLAPPPVGSPESKTPQTEKPVTASPTRVLIVEDNDDNRLMLRFVVEMKGYEVLEAADGLEGVERALAERPSLVLVDVGLPGIDGFEVARRIRKEDPNRAMRLIALTGYGSEQDRRESREAGFDDHLLKPVDQERLFAALERK